MKHLKRFEHIVRIICIMRIIRIIRIIWITWLSHAKSDLGTCSRPAPLRRLAGAVRRLAGAGELKDIPWRGWLRGGGAPPRAYRECV